MNDRTPPSWWDSFAVPKSESHPFAYIHRHSPTPEQHDYVLYTDGSGHSDGWGASAAIAKYNATGEYITRLASNYGSTVQRNELSALLDGLFAIADHQIRLVQQLGLREIPRNPWLAFAGDDRITVRWYTDRENLAKALVFDEYGTTLNARSSERDLWMRYSQMARAFCITPLHLPRNAVPTQAVCDAWCDVARNAAKAAIQQLNLVTPSHIKTLQQWTSQQKQNAIL